MLTDPTLAEVRENIAFVVQDALPDIRVQAVRSPNAMRARDGWITLQKLVPGTLGGGYDATISVTVFLSTDDAAAERALDLVSCRLMTALSAAGYNVQQTVPISIGTGGPQPMLAAETTIIAAVAAP
jgi:hypothetical protein